MKVWGLVRSLALTICLVAAPHHALAHGGALGARSADLDRHMLAMKQLVPPQAQARNEFDYMSDIAAETLAHHMIEDSDKFRRYLARDPLGVVFIIAPWNYPYLTTINTLAPALIAGNTVVLKHASQTLLVGERLAQAFHEAGVPADVFQNVVLDHATTESLIAGRAFNFVNFTGSVAGGQAIERAAAGTFTPLGLELGGKDPGYVRADANLDAAVDTLMDGAMFNSGQCCCGIERIYVHESLFDAFVEKSVAWVNGMKLGSPLDPETTLGPMANKRFAKVVRDQIAEAVAAGAKPLIDPKNFPADDGGAYLAPQILVNVDHSMRVMMEESFGPVVGIMKIKDDEEAIQAGVEDVLYSGELCLVEWPDKTPNLFPPDTIYLRLEVAGSDSRRLTIQVPN